MELEQSYTKGTVTAEIKHIADLLDYDVEEKLVWWPNILE